MKLKSRFNLGCCYKNESKHSAVKTTVSEYVQKSTIQGVAYVGDDKLNKFERLWWSAMFLCSVGGACYLMYQAYRTMRENPIIESPSLTRTPLWEVPFPAVTLCPTTKTSFALNKIYWPDVAKDLLPENYTELANDYEIAIVLQSLLLRTLDQNHYDILTQVLPEIRLNYATFGSIKADTFLQKTITYLGPCVTFNMYPEKDLLRDGVILSSFGGAYFSDEFSAVLSSFGSEYKREGLWSRDAGFNDSLPLETYMLPFRSFSATDAFVMAFNVNDFIRIGQFTSDIYVSFHTPDELPQFGGGTEFIIIKPGKQNFIEITPRLVVSEGIEHYEPEVRQCYYFNERYLQFYKNYTQSHCEKECAANYTLTHCGCVAYHMPHFSDTKLCATHSDFDCVRHKRDKFYLPNFIEGDGRAPIDACKCLPSCTQLSYEVVRTTVTLESDGNIATVYIRNKHRHIKKHIRTELHSISEFFSNCGGSLGLFLGVSIFSILELLYFCTVRLYLHSKRSPADSNE